VLSQMLGVRRASVTVAAGALQEAGLIRYRRGKVTVLDRDGLERASCECYGIVRAHFDRLLGERQ
jgi:Mn-dependent DtxR family transcriptional regulator